MSGPILVINPNSNADVTAGIDGALAPFRLSGGPGIEAVDLPGAPFGIESRRDGDAVVPLLLAAAAARPDAAAIVIACYSDPGLDALREQEAEGARRPILGMAEAGILTALARADRIGVVAAAEASIARHRPALRRMGVEARVVGERALGLTVAETAGPAARPRLIETGRALVADGAGALVLGCAGMARHRGALADATGVPVVEPVQAAVAMALGELLARRADG